MMQLIRDNDFCRPVASLDFVPRFLQLQLPLAGARCFNREGAPCIFDMKWDNQAGSELRQTECLSSNLYVVVYLQMCRCEV